MLNNGVNPKKIIISGIIMTFFFLMILAFSSPDSSEWDFYFPFALRGMGLAFMMSPILTLAVSGLQGKDMAQAVGLANMIRQLGGSVGIALINVFLTNKNAEVRGSMISYISDSNTIARDRIATFTQNYMGKGYSLEEAQVLANKAMEGILFKQQALVSYDQGFFAVGALVLICIPVVLLIRYKKSNKAIVADH
jgi:DHA2 family multidrug resistance protein